MADTTLVRRTEDDGGDLLKKPQPPNRNKQQALLKSYCQIGLRYINGSLSSKKCLLPPISNFFLKNGLLLDGFPF